MEGKEEHYKQRINGMSPYRSYDFSFKDTQLEREERRHLGPREYASRQRWQWTFVLAIGAVLAVLSFLLNLGISALNYAKIKATEHVIYATGGFWAPYCVYVGMSAGYALLAAGIVTYWAPEASGSGMSQIKAYFNGVHIGGLLTLRTLVGKFVSAMFVLAAGLIAEGEAPFVHMGAIVGGGLTAMGSRSLTRLLRGRCKVQLPRRWGGHFRNDYDHRDFTSIGAAAGMAVAFAAPLSGMVFIAEESAANLGAPVHYRALVGSGVAVLVVNLLTAAFHDGRNFWDTRLFNQLNPSTAGVLGLLTMRLWELPIIIAMSCAIGALGALFVALNSRVVHALRQRYISQASRARRTLEVVALAVVTGSIWLGISYGSPCYPLPLPALQVALQPQPVPQSITILLPFDTFPRLWCPAGYYSAFGQVFLRPPRFMLRNLVDLSQNAADGVSSLLGTQVVALYAAMTFVMLTITYGASASLGVITPVLQFGCACGLLVGHGVRALVAAAGGAAAVPVPLYTVCGAAAFLAGAVRYEATAVLITLEAIGAWPLVVPVTIAVFCAKSVADQLAPGIFEADLDEACVPVIPEPLASSRVSCVTNHLTVRDVMTYGVTALPPLVRRAHLVDVLRRCDFAAFPVTEEVEMAARPGSEFHVLGVIERKGLLRMLQHGIGVCDACGEYSLPASRAERQRLLGSFEQRPLKGSSPDAERATLQRASGAQDVLYDLRPFMFGSPLLMQEGASLTRALTLFRQMGLHHILVAPQDPRAIGFITRKDLVLDNAQLKYLHKGQP